jgi:nitrogen-specific signal transduction histidine kinase
MGLVLRASYEVAPGPDEPFLIVDGTLSVCAVSKKAEQLLEVSETQAIHRHVMDFLVPAADSETSDDLLALLADAARGAADSRETVVRPATHQEVSYDARVGTCGPPPAALIVLDAA